MIMLNVEHAHMPMRVVFTITLMIFSVLGLSSCRHSMVNEMIIEPGKRFYYEDDKFLNYRISGQGQQTIILLHGFGASGLAWSDLLPLLDETRYRYIIFDLIGSGYSSKPHNADYSMLANAVAIIKFINETQLADYSIVGHSFGGGVALLTAMEAIEGTSRPPKALVLLDAAAYKTNLPFFVDSLRTPLIGRLVLALTSADFQARYTLERIYFDKQKVSDELVQRYAFFMRMPGHDYALLQTANQVIPKNFDQLIDRYKKIRIPVLVVWGGNDPALPLTLGRRLVKDLPNASLKIIENCGHNIQEECPDRTADEISKFLDGLRD